MTVWSKALPQAAIAVSGGFESRPGHVRMLPVTWGLSFLHQLQLVSHKLAAICRKSDENKKMHIQIIH